MSTKHFSDAMNELNEKYIIEAAAYKGKTRKSIWVHWSAMAACLCLIIVGFLGAQGNWFSEKNETTVLSSGECITFHKTNMAGVAIDLDLKTKAMTAEELAEVFGTLPVTEANAYFSYDENKFVGLEGKYANMKLVISAPGVQMLDVVIEGNEAPSAVAGVPITAGYFVTNANSQGMKTAIYYAHLELDDCTIFIENAGSESEREKTKANLALAAEQLITSEICLDKMIGAS